MTHGFKIDGKRIDYRIWDDGPIGEYMIEKLVVEGLNVAFPEGNSNVERWNEGGIFAK